MARETRSLENGATIVITDSITEATEADTGCILVAGSHGGANAAYYAVAVRGQLVAFNDAGGGKDLAGIIGLDILEGNGLAALTVSHNSARIGDARDTLESGIVSHCNALAADIGWRPGMRLIEGLRSLHQG